MSSASIGRAGPHRADLTPTQERAVAHTGGPLLVLGGAGSGKTTVLAARFARLVADGIAPESILALSPSGSGAADLRRRIEDALEGPYEELPVHSVREFCTRLLRDETAEAGVDPFFAPVTRADRLALLLDRMDDLHLRSHDIAGRPAVLLAGVIDRIDRLKEEFVTAADYVAWADALPCDSDAHRTRAAREVEFARLYVDHDRLLAEQGALDGGELVLRAVALLRGRPHVRARAGERFRHVLVDELADLGFASALLVELLGAEHENLSVTADDDAAARRVRAAATTNIADFERAHPAAGVVRLERSLRCPQRVLDAARAVVEPIAGRLGTPLVGEPGGTVRFWRAADERAQAQAVAAEVQRLVRGGCAP
ncbi:MAG: ATP-dependent helicase UvrD/PcrA, partial [Solirubrobacteraceae bacterium]|nr:ATP-dependent helicase UvrD/PcrA [Solirubrobacteraceae bacterium]